MLKISLITPGGVAKEKIKKRSLGYASDRGVERFFLRLNPNDKRWRSIYFESLPETQNE
ncbi:hypothetical protein GCM10008969_28680 [Pseudomonas veronii subsp. inensis]|jgi:hypothetical protein